jgi:acetyl esterase
MAVDQDLSEAATTGDAAAQGLRGSFACAPRGRDGRLRYPERGRRKSPPSADDNRTTGSDDERMSDQLTVTPVVLEPAAQAFAEATADPPYLFDLGPVEGRKTVDEVQSGEIEKPDVDIEDTIVPGGPSGEVSVRIMRPRGATGLLPVVIYIHGAGWVFGNSHTHDRLIRELTVGANAAVVFPNYSLSPEARYPTALEESYAVLRWVADHGADKGLDAARIAIAGDSVGGNMTAALTLMAKERSGPSLVAQLLFYQVTNASFDTDSYREFATGYFLRRDAMRWFWDQYTTEEAQRDEITASPLRASTEQLAGLPPALVVTAEADVLRDEGEAYGRKLRAAGIDVTATRYEAVIHDFVMLNPLRETNGAGAAINQAIGFLRARLGA